MQIFRKLKNTRNRHAHRPASTAYLPLCRNSSLRRGNQERGPHKIHRHGHLVLVGSVRDEVHRCNVPKEKTKVDALAKNRLMNGMKALVAKAREEGDIGVSPSCLFSRLPLSKANTLTTSSSLEETVFSEAGQRRKRKAPEPISTETRNVAPGTLNQKIELLRQRIPWIMAVLVDRPSNLEVSLESLMRRISREVDLKAVGTSIKHMPLTKSGGYLMEIPSAKDAAVVSDVVAKVVGDKA